MKSTDKTPKKENKEEISTQSVDANDNIIQSPIESADIRETIEGSIIDNVESPIRAMPPLVEEKEEFEEIVDEKFLASFDDSSDEDEDLRESYDLIGSLYQFTNKGRYDANYYRDIFYSHALGIQILRAPLIRKIYYEYKKNYLKYEEGFLNDEIISSWLNECFQKALKSFFLLPSGNEELSDEILRKFLEENNSRIEHYIKEALSQKRDLLKSFNTGYFEIGWISDISNLLQEFLTQLKKDRFISGKTLVLPRELTFDDIKDDFNIQNGLEDIVKQYKESYIDSLDRQPSNKSALKHSKDAMNKYKKQNDQTPDSPEKRATEKLLSSPDNLKSLSKVRDELSKYLLEEHLRELEIQMKSNNLSPLYNHLKHAIKQKLSALHGEFSDCKGEKIVSLFDKEFSSLLISELVNSRKCFFRENAIERKVLDNGEIFDLSNEDDFFPKFLATLNLCNRSAKRYLRDLNDSEWDRIIEEESGRRWKFPASEKILSDNHKFTIKGKRSDETSELGSYKKVFEIIIDIRTKLNKYKASDISVINDSDIALWIRQIIRGDSLDHLINTSGQTIKINQNPSLIKKVKFDLTKIAYLIFGSEVVRNPASLIHQQMTLDLIIDKWISFENAFYKDRVDNGGEMPMSMKEAIGSARILHEFFQFYTDLNYVYGLNPNLREEDRLTSSVSRDYKSVHETAKERELLQREYDISQKWFWYMESSLKEKSLKLNNNIDQAKIDILLEALPRWYGIQLLWYTGDQINNLLNQLLTENIRIIAPIPLANNSALINNIQTALNNLQTAAVLPFNLNNNHWVGLVLRRDVNGVIRAIYNDPMGNELTNENRNLLEYYLRMYNGHNPIEIIDLNLAQQTNGYDCGPITVNNLVRLALAENIDFSSRETIIQEARLISAETQDENLRQRHCEILLMQSEANGEINPSNVERLAELLNEERSSDQEDEELNEQLTNLGLTTTLLQEETIISQINGQVESKEENSTYVTQPSSAPTSIPSSAASSIPSFVPTSYTINSIHEEAYIRSSEMGISDSDSNLLFLDIFSFW